MISHPMNPNWILFSWMDRTPTNYVYNDTEVALKLMRDGKGIIMWHDYGWREVVQALNEIYTENEVLKNAKNIENTSLVFLKLD